MPGFGSSSSNRNNLSADEALKRAYKLHQQGNIADAEVFYKKSIDAGSKNPIAFVNLGIIYKISGRLSLASDCYQSAIRISPDFQPAYLNLGNLLQ